MSLLDWWGRNDADRTIVQVFGVKRGKPCDCSGRHVGHVSIIGAVAS